MLGAGVTHTFPSKLQEHFPRVSVDLQAKRIETVVLYKKENSSSILNYNNNLY